MKPELNKTLLIFIFAVLFLFNGLHIDAQQSKYNEEISDELLKLAEERFELIKNDLSDSKTNEWTGIYISNQGTTVSTLLGWSEKSGYVTRWYNCSRPWTERINYGAVEFSNDRLKITPTLTEKEKSSHIIGSELLPVKWDEQHFLIPQNELINFAYAVHSNSESQMEKFFVKNDDRDKSRKGFPNLPREFEKFLTMKAIKPKVTNIKKSGDDIWEDEITLNMGLADNIIEKMFFYVSDPSGDIILMITDARKDHSKAKIVSSANAKKLKIGMKLTSRMPKNYFEM